MGSDPKKPADAHEELDDEGSTAMFSREAHGWFSSMADAQETDPDSVADLGRNAVIESSPLSRTGNLPAQNLSRTGSIPAATLPRTGSMPAARTASNVPATDGPGSTRAPASSAAPMDGRRVVVLAFMGGALVAAAIGAAAFFLLTAH